MKKHKSCKTRRTGTREGRTNQILHRSNLADEASGKRGRGVRRRQTKWSLQIHQSSFNYRKKHNKKG